MGMEAPTLNGPLGDALSGVRSPMPMMIEPIQPRMLGDFRDDSSEADGEVPPATNADRVNAMPADERMLWAEEFQRRLREKRKAEIEPAEGRIIHWLRELKIACEARRPDNFDAIMENADRRLKNIVITRLNRDGSIDTSHKDGNAEANTPAGFSSEAIRTAAAAQSQKFLESSRRPYRLIGRGRKTENRQFAEVASNLNDWLCTRGGFKPLARRVALSRAAYGTAFVRMEMVRPVKIKLPSEDGSQPFREEPGDPVPCYTLWPIRQVFLTHPQLP